MAASAPRAFGSGWLSGVLSVTLGTIGLGAVFCFHYPSLLTMPELRGLYPVPFIRALLHLVLVSSFIAGVISVCLRHRKILGMAGISLTLIAALLVYAPKRHRALFQWLSLAAVAVGIVVAVLARTAVLTS